jgi:pimeloyl-ACP methyl ester carboxylesterase
VAPHGTLRIVDGAGHSVVLERPSDLAAEIVY